MKSFSLAAYYAPPTPTPSVKGASRAGDASYVES